MLFRSAVFYAYNSFISENPTANTRNIGVTTSHYITDQDFFKLALGNTDGTIDKTKFNIGSALSSEGSIDITNNIDSVKIANGNKGTIVSGQVEWSYINTSNGTNTLYVDLRKFGNTNVSTITQMKILDVYEGPVT